MKDAKGHGSSGKGGAKASAKGMRLIATHTSGAHSAKVYNNPEWNEKVVQFFRNGQYQKNADSHTDDLSDAHATAKAGLARYSSLDKPSSNAEAAQSLMSGLKSTMVPTHDAMTGVGPNDPRVGSRDYDAFGRPRSADSKSEYDEGSRDMALRSRNGQIGSGVKFRG